MDSIFDNKKNRLGTFCTQWDFIEDRFGMKDLLPFSISDTDYECPPVILEALRARMDHGVFGYTRWNHDKYKDAIVGWYDRRFKTHIHKQDIVYSPSVCYSIAKIMNMKTDIGDHVIFLTPSYDAFFKLIENNLRVGVGSDLISEEGYFTINFTALDQLLSHPKAKVFLLCSPHNPTGRVWTKQELSQLIEMCQKHGVFLISDEIHMDVIRSEKKHWPIFKVVSDMKDSCICTSASKTFNTPGLGGAYAIIPDQEMRAEFLLQSKARDHVSHASIFGTTALVTGYMRAEVWLDELNTYLEANMAYLKQFFDQYFPEIEFKIPESTFLAWVDVSSLPYTENEIQQALIHVGKVAFMKGSTYGEAGTNYLRINVGCSCEKLVDGMNRFKKAIDYLRRDKE